jgi:hypothetical protein
VVKVKKIAMIGASNRIKRSIMISYTIGVGRGVGDDDLITGVVGWVVC